MDSTGFNDFFIKFIFYLIKKKSLKGAQIYGLSGLANLGLLIKKELGRMLFASMFFF
jgi:hypothetical protein